MHILKTTNISVVTVLSTIVVAISGLGVTAPVLADLHEGRANAGIVYNSALSNYRTLDGNQKKGWIQSNDTVGKIGGWRTYANEAYEASKAVTEEQLSDVGKDNLSPEQSLESVGAAALASDLSTAQPTITKDDAANMMAETNLVATSHETPKASAALSYQSVTQSHRAYEEITLQDWKAANNRVGEIGGWRTYANEAYKANTEMSKDSGANQ